MYRKYRVRQKSFEFREKNTVETDFPYDPHFHDCYEIYYLKAGDVSYMVEGNHYDMKPGDLMLTNPRELHCPIVGPKEYHRITLSIHPLYLSSFITEDYNPFSSLANRPLGSRNRIDASIVSANGLDKLINTIGEYYNSTLPSKNAMIKAYSLILLEAINHIIQVDKLTFTHERISDIIHYINDNLAEKITLTSLANIFNLNKHYLSHAFHDKMGMTLTDYITGKRIQHALELMEGNCTLLEIALQSGFSDYAAFYRAFHKFTGMNPAQYQKSMKR